MLDRKALAAALSLSIACSGAFASRGCGSARAKPLAGSALPTIVFEDTCDGSGAVLFDGRLIVANDEDNVLRVYDAQKGGRPLAVLDLDPVLQAAATRSGQKRAKEADLEAGTLLGDTLFWIGSHGLDASGKLRPERRSLLGTSSGAGGAPLLAKGLPYQRLLADLSADARYAAFGLAQAAERVPKEDDGLNIEALAPRLAGGLWIGFRSPSPGGKALLAALLNPGETIEGKTAQLGEPRLLDLDGLGTRDLVRFRSGYLLIAGAQSSGGVARLFSWDGQGAARALSEVQLEQLNPEALVVSADARKVLVLSDDGTRELGGKECKKLADNARKRFRGMWLSAKPGW